MKTNYRCWLLNFAFLFSRSLAPAQDSPVVIPSVPTFALDVKSFETKGAILFDKSFNLMLTSVASTVTRIKVEVRTGLDDTKGDLVGNQSDTPITNHENITITVSAHLKPNNSYHLRIQMLDPSGDRIVNYGFTLKTKMGDYIKLDLGLGYTPNVKGVISHTAVHFYLLPINNDTDLRTIKGLGKNVFLRTSFFVGISPVTLYSNTEQPIVNASGIGNIIYGIGIRSPFYGRHMPFNRNIGWVFLQPLRVNFGQMYFKQEDASPLISNNKNKLAFYYGISYDLNIAGVLGPVGKLIKP